MERRTESVQKRCSASSDSVQGLDGATARPAANAPASSGNARVSSIRTLY
jgi:hypothetical protein